MIYTCFQEKTNGYRKDELFQLKQIQILLFPTGTLSMVKIS